MLVGIFVPKQCCPWREGSSPSYWDSTKPVLFFTEFQATRSLLQPAVLGSSQAAQNGRQEPPNLVVKINCDASVNDSGFVGIGFVIRDSLGERAGVDRIQGDIGVDCAEASAVRSALCFVKNYMFNRLIDC